MASSGSSGRPNSKGFEFVSDDILCSYDDFGAPDGANGNLSEPAIGVAQAKQDFHKSRMARPATYPIYSPQEDSFSQDVISAVDKTMKKYADNLLRFLEGISSRMSQLELYCYNVDKSIGEMRSDLVRDHEEADTRLKSLEKHLQEVHRSVRILRDKQELAETQKELAKLQLVQKESSSSSHAPQNEERPTMPSGDSKRTDNASEINNQQLALALPRQVAQQPPLSQDPQAAPPQNIPQQQSYYLPPATVPNPQHTPGSYMPSDPPRYQTPSLQDISSSTRVAQQPSQPLASQAPVVHSLPQYAQQWPPQMRPPPTSTAVYAYPTQPANPSPSEMLPSSVPLQMPFPGVAQPGSSRAEALPYGFGGAGRVVPQPPQHAKGAAFGGAQPGDGYPAPPAPRPHAALPPGSAYMIYDAEGTRGPHHVQQSPFPGGSYMLRNQSPPQFVRNNPYTELIDKLVNMGYMGSHVVDVIQRMEESGQQVDFNSVLDRLNGHSSASSSQRGGW